MTKIIASTNDAERLVNIDGLDYPRGIYTVFYRDVEETDGVINESLVKVGVKSTSAENDVVINPQYISEYLDATDTPYTTLDDLMTDLALYLGFNRGGASSQGSNTTITVTKTELDDLISNSGLVVGSTYEITGVHPALYDDGAASGTTIFLTAVTTSELSIEGQGIFYNPKYTSTLLQNIWQNVGTFDVINVVGSFQTNEDFTTDQGGLGKLVVTENSGYFLRMSQLGWGGSTTITGSSSGATADIANISFRDIYLLGRKVIWGGYTWENISSESGMPVDALNLNPEDWEKVPYSNSIYYTKVVNTIRYDLANDTIIYRGDELNNIVQISKEASDELLNKNRQHPISVFQWGNPYDSVRRQGAANNFIQDSYVENVNMSIAFFDNDFTQKSLFCENIFINVENTTSGFFSSTFDSSDFKSNVILGDIFGNSCTYSRITSNSVDTSSTIIDNFLNINSTIGDTTLTNSCSVSNNNLYNGSQITSVNLKNTSSISQNSLLQLNLTQYKAQNNSGINTCNLSNGVLDFNQTPIFDTQTITSADVKSVQSPLPDLTTAVLVFNPFLAKEVMDRLDGLVRLKYINNSDVQIIVPITT